ncbi:hypothetical protein ACIPSJ_41085 [Streptomyces sp. NPDC090088]|uniref:hypothetical protein n=1 Tax=Streptomyces sp. NPDC090088 TaxID=3365944 RepID=UPI003811279D
MDDPGMIRPIDRSFRHNLVSKSFHYMPLVPGPGLADPGRHRGALGEEARRAAVAGVCAGQAVGALVLQL